MYHFLYVRQKKNNFFSSAGNVWKPNEMDKRKLKNWKKKKFMTYESHSMKDFGANHYVSIFSPIFFYFLIIILCFIYYVFHFYNKTWSIQIVMKILQFCINVYFSLCSFEEWEMKLNRKCNGSDFIASINPFAGALQSSHT